MTGRAKNRTGDNSPFSPRSTGIERCPACRISGPAAAAVPSARLITRWGHAEDPCDPVQVPGAITHRSGAISLIQSTHQRSTPNRPHPTGTTPTSRARRPAHSCGSSSSSHSRAGSRRTSREPGPALVIAERLVLTRTAPAQRRAHLMELALGCVDHEVTAKLQRPTGDRVHARRTRGLLRRSVAEDVVESALRAARDDLRD